MAKKSTAEKQTASNLMLVEYTGKNILRLLRPPKVATDAKGATRMKYDADTKRDVPVTFPQEPLAFMPGINIIDSKEWDEVNAHPTMKFRVEERILRVVNDSKSHVRDFKASEALDIVGRTYDVDILKAWSEDESLEKEVKAALATQIL